MAKVVILDAQYLTRKGLEVLLEEHQDHSVLAACQEKSEFEAALLKHKPKIAIIDADELLLENPGLIQHWKSCSALTELLLFTQCEDPVLLNTFLKFGVRSILTKVCSETEIKSALRSIAQGNKFICNTVLDFIIHHDPVSSVPINTPLSNREMEILSLIAKGQTTAKIADTLFVSVHTINSHRKNILKKLNLSSPTELIVYAFENGIVSVNGSKQAY